MFKTRQDLCVHSKFIVGLLILLTLLTTPFFLHVQTVFADVVAVTGTYDYSATQRMLDLINSSRAEAGLGALTYNYGLDDYAKQRAAEITVLNSHLRPDGSNVAYSENYSIGWENADLAHQGFMASSGHRSNIMNPNFASMAGGVFLYGGTYYWVQVFSTAGGSGGALSGQVTETRSVNVAGGMAAPVYGDLNDSIVVQVGDGIFVDVGVEGQMLSAVWSSDNPQIATVSSDGYISGISEGTALITGVVMGQTVRIQVTVKGSGTPAAPVPAAAPVAAPTAAPTMAPTAAPVPAVVEMPAVTIAPATVSPPEVVEPAALLEDAEVSSEQSTVEKTEQQASSRTNNSLVHLSAEAGTASGQDLLASLLGNRTVLFTVSISGIVISLALLAFSVMSKS